MPSESKSPRKYGDMAGGSGKNACGIFGNTVRKPSVKFQSAVRNFLDGNIWGCIKVSYLDPSTLQGLF